LNNTSHFIYEELDSKSKIIQNKFDIYKSIQEKTILFLSNYYKKRQIISEKIKNIVNFKKLRINIINYHCQTAFKKTPLSQLEEILNLFILNNSIFNTAFQKKIFEKLSNK
jgi:UDP-N-acetylmuramyl pentapeptide synthase